MWECNTAFFLKFLFIYLFYKAIRPSLKKDTVFKPGKVRKHNGGNLKIFHKAGLGLECKR